MRKLCLLLLLVSLPVWTASALAESQEMVRYIGLDFHGNAGTLYDDQFEAFPPSGEDFTGRTVWVLGLRVQIVRLTPDGTIEDKTEDDQYTRVLHRSVLAYTGKSDTDGISDQRPIHLGPEMTDFDFPSPYAYKLSGGRLYNFMTEALNMSGLPDNELVFVKLTLLYDDAPDAPYLDTNVTWIDSRPGRMDFCVPPGPWSYAGTPYTIQTITKPVLVVPHMHDHSTGLTFVHRRDQVTQTIMRFAGEASTTFSYHFSDGRCPTTPWHNHSVSGHLKPKTLNVWTLADSDQDGETVFLPTDLVWSECSYSNPHGADVDGMGTLIMFYAAE